MAVYTRSVPSVTRQPEDTFIPMRQVIDRLFQDSFPFTTPVTGYRSGSSTANAYATPAGYEVQIALPGMKSDSITVTVEKNWLKVKAESGLKTPEQGKTIWQSFGGPAEFTIQLPSEVESGQAQASYDAGVLTVTLPKAASLLPHTIKVSAN